MAKSIAYNPFICLARGVALNEDNCQDQDNKDDSISVVADQNLEMVECETIQ